MPTSHAYQRYRNIKLYAYMVTSIHPEIPPTSKIDDWIKNRTNTIYIQSHIPYGDNKDNCHIIIKRCPYKLGGSCQPQNQKHNTCPQTHVHMSIRYVPSTKDVHKKQTNIKIHA